TTRYLIDEQLRKVGWEADSKNLRYAKGTRPEAGRNIAIANWPTDPAICAWGNMDYALFAGLKLIGVVEAKATHKNIETLINQQCRDYSKGVKDEHLEYVIDAQNIYRSPFLFATNGRPYQQQSETKSGIWFGDTREGGQAPKVLQGWVSPQGLLDMLDFNIDAANQKLAESSFSPLRDNEGLNLRPYQIEAIKKAEAAIVAGQKNVLLAMADGAGKTRTMLGMMYRFLKTGRFKKILFLIDRTDLSEQVLETFKEVRIEDLLTLWQLYDIRDFAGQNSKQDAKIQVDTVQNLVRRIIYNDAETMPSVMEYDLIVIDDAHRSSTVELKESDNELLYQSQPDYLNKYRTILEYFDAIKVALTATPVPHSAEIFGSPVFTYNDPTGDAKVAVQLEEAIRLIRVAVGELTK
ncbi:MAG: DEAD/DEAH box helicase family protein, partial [Clostridiales bacterium]|nr:DEAD/DEAH box helicase family protein [Clostridiales bacterium]